MSASFVGTVPVLDEALSVMHDAVDELLSADYSRESNDAILDGLRDAERLRRRLSALDHQLIAQVERRGLAFTSNARDTAVLLAGMLRISTHEARARTAAAAVCGPRIPYSGPTLESEFAQVAAAQADGDICAEHARLITRTMHDLPPDVDAEYAQTVHDQLLKLARICAPEVVATAGRHALVLADQDGKAPDADDRRAHRRGLTVRPRPDGSSSVVGELTAECTEALQTFLDTHAAPRPAAADGVKDQRSAAKRSHDAVLDGLKLLLRTADAASTGGVAVTVLLTITAQDWASGRGHATTGHGAVIPAATAIGWAGGDARVLAVVLDDCRAVAGYSSTRRIFSRNQRLAMDARDKGCTFPGCAAPPGWCEAHHVTDYRITGTTSIADGALVCGYDHRERVNQGWATTMIDGRPHWVPPPWVDPDQVPIRNTMHDFG